MRITAYRVAVLAMLLSASALRADDEPEQSHQRPPGVEQKEKVQEQFRERREAMEQRRQEFEKKQEALRSRRTDVVRTAQEWRDFVQALIDNVAGGNLQIDVQSSSERGEDGEPQSKRSARITIVGPDGVPRQFTFGGNDYLQEDSLSAKDRQSRFRLGIVLEPVSDLLRSHLKLQPGEGIAVGKVFEGSPAAKAGLKEHDILVAAGDQPVNEAAKLMELIEQSGANLLTLDIIRMGERMSVDVTPVASEEWDLPELDEKLSLLIERGFVSPPSPKLRGRPGDKQPKEEGVENKKERGVLDIEIQSVRPGVVIETDEGGLLAEDQKLTDQGTREDEVSLKEQIRLLSKQIDALQHAVEELKSTKE